MESSINEIIYLFGENLPTALFPGHLAPQPQLAHHDEILARDGHRVQEVDDAPVELGVHHLCELVVQGLAEILFNWGQQLYSFCLAKLILDGFLRPFAKKNFSYLIPSLPGLLNSGFM